MDISDIEKGLYHAWSDYEYKEGCLYSTTFRDGWLMAIDWYKKKLESIDTSSIASANGVSVNLTNFTGTHNGITVSLPKKEAYVLHYMITNKNRVVNRKELLSAVWEEGVIVDARTIDVHLCKLKKRLGLQNYLINVKGVGYIWKRTQ